MNHRPTETGFGVTGLYHGDEGFGPPSRVVAPENARSRGIF
jgi:hypothetical protein